MTLQGPQKQQDARLGPSTVAVDTLLILPLSCQAWAGGWERMSQLQCQAPRLLTTGTPNSTHPWAPTTRGLNPAPKLASVGPAGAFLSLGLCGYSLCRARRPQFLTAHGGGGRVGRDIGFRPQVPFQLCHFAQDDREKPHKTE